MPRSLIAVPVIALATLGLGAPAAEAALPTTVVVYTSVPNPPFALRRNGRLTGFDIQLVEKAARAVGIRAVEWRPVAFNVILPDIAGGGAPMGASSITITAARRRLVTFGDPYLDADFAIVTRRNSTITGPRGLRNRTVGAVKGTTAVAAADAILGTTVVSYPGQNAAYRALLDATVVAVINDYPQSTWYVRNNASKFRIASSIEGQADIALAFGKKQNELRSAFNRGLSRLRSNGDYDALVRTWITG